MIKAFPHPGDQGTLTQPQYGMDLLDWFATFAPEPTEAEIQQQADNDRVANPHGDNYKPKRRSRREIIADLKYAYAKAMTEARTRHQS